MIRDHVSMDEHVLVKDWVKRPQVTAIIPLLDKKQIVLVRQYRHGVNKTLWELPAGTVDEKESALSCAKRECEEETGYRPQTLYSLGSFFPAPASSNEIVHLYWTDRLKKSKMNLDIGEKIELGFFDMKKVRQMLDAKKIEDAKSIIGLYRYFLK